jgi:hypothetical protein
MSSLPIPREIKPKQKAYAFERSFGVMPAEACRRAGGNVRNGQATKWEQSSRVQAWIKYYREFGHLDEILQAQIHKRLQAPQQSN